MSTAVVERPLPVVGAPPGRDPHPSAPASALRADVSVLRVSLLIVAVLAGAFAAQVLVLGSLQHRAAQQGRFDELRDELAQGTAPVGPADADRHLLPEGTPLALLEIPSIGVKEIVGEGTRSAVLADGPGHRRDTVLPGAAGTSIVYGRQAAYGGPFGRLRSLRVGATVKVTSGLGVSTFKVVDTRRAGDATPPPVAAGGARLLLVTATGTPFAPSGVLRVDADLDGTAPVVARNPVVLSRADQPMQADTSTVWALVLWLEAAVAVAVAAAWSWYRWGRPQTWVVFLPLGLLVGLAVAGQVTKLLPNLL